MMGHAKIMFSLGILWLAPEKGIACTIPPAKRLELKCRYTCPPSGFPGDPQSIAMGFSPFSVGTVWCPLGQEILLYD